MLQCDKPKKIYMYTGQTFQKKNIFRIGIKLFEERASFITIVIYLYFKRDTHR